MLNKCMKCNSSLHKSLVCDKCEAVHELCPWCKALVLDTQDKCSTCGKNVYVSLLTRIGWKIHKVSIVIYMIAAIAVGYKQYMDNRNLLEASIFGAMTFVIFFTVFNGAVFFILRMENNEKNNVQDLLEKDE
ncbi:hypothetical protein [Candidatus Uabimicrobium amorphum]|uniref:Uncharacterized protein n=1 Tax=Uabimicrobium amorphum TaxID=2596890 RepID=A0A5S9IPR8_UABAM|nr:hypothetical protein [Candidatus Uabimicrobium amorphum]BBM84900.1 hypothetical protein UABAM_03261 [Candidatus Uabimicrobium amorphum]